MEVGWKDVLTQLEACCEDAAAPVHVMTAMLMCTEWA